MRCAARATELDPEGSSAALPVIRRQGAHRTRGRARPEVGSPASKGRPSPRVPGRALLGRRALRQGAGRACRLPRRTCRARPCRTRTNHRCACIGLGSQTSQRTKNRAQLQSVIRLPVERVLGFGAFLVVGSPTGPVDGASPFLPSPLRVALAACRWSACRVLSGSHWPLAAGPPAESSPGRAGRPPQARPPSPLRVALAARRWPARRDLPGSRWPPAAGPPAESSPGRAGRLPQARPPNPLPVALAAHRRSARRVLSGSRWPPAAAPPAESSPSRAGRRPQPRPPNPLRVAQAARRRPARRALHGRAAAHDRAGPPSPPRSHQPPASTPAGRSPERPASRLPYFGTIL